jgi:hypothetical protein
MKTLVVIMLLVIVGLSATIYTQHRTNTDLNKAITARNLFIERLRQEKMAWEEAVRPIVTTACQVRLEPSFCDRLVLVPNQFQSAAAIWAGTLPR